MAKFEGKREIFGILENPDGFLWLIKFCQGNGVSLGIEDFEGKLVKVTRTNEKIIIEVVKEVEPVPWEQFHKSKEVELCAVQEKVMPCKCQAPGCDNPCVCGEKYCDQCFLDIVCEDDVERNLFLGGRFYGENLLKEDTEASASANANT